MVFEVRLVIHKRDFEDKPDYTDVHRRMKSAGFWQAILVGNQLFQTLNGMYRIFTSYGSPDSVASLVDQAMRGFSHEISYQVFQVVDEKSYNLKPLSYAYGSMLSAIYSAEPQKAKPATLSQLLVNRR